MKKKITTLLLCSLLLSGCTAEKQIADEPELETNEITATVSIYNPDTLAGLLTDTNGDQWAVQDYTGLAVGQEVVITYDVWYDIVDIAENTK